MKVETKQEFWEKWMPCDWPPREPPKSMKRRFYKDLGDLTKAECLRRKESADED